MRKFDFAEIADWQEFEDLVADYFQILREENRVMDVTVEPSGAGTDGGRDILVTFQFSDFIVSFPRRWVVQCKFYHRTVSKADLAEINIPTLIHEYGADGYLLVCQGQVSSKVTEMFENLRRNCKFGYDYMVWTGNILGSKLLSQERLLQQYFPEYYEEGRQPATEWEDL